MDLKKVEFYSSSVQNEQNSTGIWNVENWYMYWEVDFQNHWPSILKFCPLKIETHAQAKWKMNLGIIVGTNIS